MYKLRFGGRPGEELASLFLDFFFFPHQSLNRSQEPKLPCRSRSQQPHFALAARHPECSATARADLIPTNLPREVGLGLHRLRGRRAKVNVGYLSFQTPPPGPLPMPPPLALQPSHPPHPRGARLCSARRSRRACKERVVLRARGAPLSSSRTWLAARPRREVLQPSA